MTTYILTPAAEAELQSIVDFIRRDDADMALHVVEAIERAMELIVGSPGIGRLRDDFVEEDLRVWIVYSYLIVYRPTTRPLEVVHVLHGARDLAAALASGRGPESRAAAKKRRKR